MKTDRFPVAELFDSIDGEGKRTGYMATFVRFAGCNLRCSYCDTAYAWTEADAGEHLTEAELLDRIHAYPWKRITLTGGEPLLQLDFLLELFAKAKARGIHTCIDTAGQPFTRQEPFFGKFHMLMKVTDLLLVDIKHIDPQAHEKLTGCPNTNSLDLFRYLSEIKKPVWIRQVLVPGYTDDPESLARTRDFINTLANVERVEVLPYHNMGLYKWEKLGVPNQLRDVKPPTEEAVQKARVILGAV